MDIAAEKRTLRKQMKTAKQRLTDAEKRMAGERLMRCIERDERVRQCSDIVLYWSMDDELPTHELAERLRRTKRVYLPVIVGERLELRRFEGEERMSVEPRYGIAEPTSGELLEDDAEGVVIVVPGVAFTREGKRLGRGGGFYDRMLAQQKRAVKIGVGFACQRVDDLPTEEHDWTMDEVYLV